MILIWILPGETTAMRGDKMPVSPILLRNIPCKICILAKGQARPEDPHVVINLCKCSSVCLLSLLGKRIRASVKRS